MRYRFFAPANCDVEFEIRECPETTEDPDTCSCDVSKYDVEDLKERLERVERSLAGSDIGSLESTVNDVLNGVSTMQQCIAKMVLPGMEETTEMPRDTTRMDYETTMMDTTKMPMDTTKMDYETTMKAIETTMKQYDTTMPMKDTTMPMKDTTMMDTTMMKDTTMMDTTMKATTMMDPTMKATTMMDTTMPATTMMDTTIRPTSAFEMYGTFYAANLKCQSGTGARTFKNSFSDFVDVPTCVKTCRDDPNCKYATTDGTTHCIGCREVPTAAAPGWSVYKAYDARRQLTAQEVMRIENAALRARLDELMRN